MLKLFLRWSFLWSLFVYYFFRSFPTSIDIALYYLCPSRVFVAFLSVISSSLFVRRNMQIVKFVAAFLKRWENLSSPVPSFHDFQCLFACTRPGQCCILVMRVLLCFAWFRSLWWLIISTIDGSCGEVPNIFVSLLSLLSECRMMYNSLKYGAESMYFCSIRI